MLRRRPGESVAKGPLVAKRVLSAVLLFAVLEVSRFHEGLGASTRATTDWVTRLERGGRRSSRTSPTMTALGERRERIVTVTGSEQRFGYTERWHTAPSATQRELADRIRIM